MSLRVLLNNAPVFEVLEPWYDTPDFGRVGLAFVAGYLRAHSDHSLAIVDSKLERLDFQETLRRIKEFEPDVVGFTAFTNEIRPAARMAGMVKALSPGTITVIGGVHVTALPAETLEEFPEFDFGIYGEGEETFRQLVEAVEAGGPAHEIEGLVHRSGAGIEVTPPRERILDLDSIPFPAWDLLPDAKGYYVQTQRGCPFACKFCMNPNGKFARRRTVANILEELELIIDRHHPETIWYGDEIFTVDVEHTKELLRAKIERGIPNHVDWFASTHVRFVDDELFALMKQSNVKIIGFGIETGNEDVLKVIGKGTSIDMIVRAREGARRAGVPITTYFILGQLNETVASILETIDLGVRLNPELPIFGVMVPYPGTEVARLAARGEAGYRLLSKNWDDYNKQVGGALAFANISRTQIELLQLYAYVKVFLWNRRFRDLAKFVWEYRTAGLSILKGIASRVVGASRGAEDEPRPSEGQDPRRVEAATERWQQWQVSELARAKREAPKRSVSLPARITP